MSAVATPAGAAPDPALDWHAIDWRQVYRTVRRLQVRIVKAVQEGRWHKVKALVYLLTHSFSGRALAILRVVSNSGATTPGVDGILWNTPELKSAAFSTLRRHGYQPQPLRRVYIPKSNGKLRPLGIPTLTDRAMQALYLLGLDPIVETQADPNSYGFRRERACVDALEQCHIQLSGRSRPEWILEGDIKSCFDRISHEWLLTHVPMDRVLLRSWLKAGFLEKDVFFATTDGTPQGGIISPALANRTLDGLESRLAERFGATPSRRRRHKVHLVRYADDFIITGTSKKLLRDEVRPLVAHFLKERGLELSHEKTNITHIENGFDFLGQNVRRYGTKILSKPSRRNVQAFLTRIREMISEQGGSQTAGELIVQLNRQIIGWSLYHRHAASKRTFTQVDRRIFGLVWRWCRRRHDQKSAPWVKERYFTEQGQRRWVFTGSVRDHKGKPHEVTLREAAKVSIQRHTKIRGAANPYDPAWELYFDERLTRKMQSTLDGRDTISYLWKTQSGRCPRCGQTLTEESGWHLHHRRWRVHGGDDSVLNLELLHANCHRQIHSAKLEGNQAASREGRW
jgi:RNA-directed DNA polymerase